MAGHFSKRKPTVEPDCGLSQFKLAYAAFSAEEVEGQCWHRDGSVPFKGKIVSVERGPWPNWFKVHGETIEGEGFQGVVFSKFSELIQPERRNGRRLPITKVPEPRPDCGFSRFKLAYAVFSGEEVAGRYWFKNQLFQFRGTIDSVTMTSTPGAFIVTGTDYDRGMPGHEETHPHTNTFFGHLFTTI